MTKTPVFAAALIAALLTCAIHPAAAADPASLDDTAKFLAGMPVAAESPLAPLTKERYWQDHAKALDRSFGNVETKQLVPIRQWQKDNMPPAKSTLFYLFSGPDFLYANAFFPGASTYVLAGLEPAGQIPDVQRTRGAGLSHLQHSMRALLAVSFFITANMREDLSGGSLRGTIPILMIFAARAGKQVKDVSLVEIDNDGAVQPDAGAKSKSAARGVKIMIKDADGREQTIYYFTTNLENSGVSRGGFFKFLAKLAPGDAFVKSASYLMHQGSFSKVAQFLVDHSAAILEDDSGVPLKYFAADKWQLKPYGNYLPPLEIFPGTHQPKLRDLFKKDAAKLPFGAGYRWRPGESNLLLAISK